jgi:hypothetical protein
MNNSYLFDNKTLPHLFGNPERSSESFAMDFSQLLEALGGGLLDEIGEQKNGETASRRCRAGKREQGEVIAG